MALIRIVRFTLAPESRSKAQSMADDLIPAIKEQPGCHGAWFAADDDGECGMVIQWESRERADAAAEIIGPRLTRHLRGNTVAPADIQLLPIIAS